MMGREGGKGRVGGGGVEEKDDEKVDASLFVPNLFIGEGGDHVGVSGNI